MGYGINTRKVFRKFCTHIHFAAQLSRDPTLNDVDFNLGRLHEAVGAGVAGVDAAVLRPRALQDQRADGRVRLVDQHAHSAARRSVVDRLKELGHFIITFGRKNNI